jgi:serine/threonine-protein kinase RsbW
MDEPDTIRLDVPASYKYLHLLAPCLAEMLVRFEDLAEREVTVYNLQLALHEVCTNIVEHAYAGTSGGRVLVSLTLHEQARCLVIEVQDSGSSFAIESVAEPDLEQAQEGGYGLFLVRSLMDEVTYTPGGPQNIWRLVKQLPTTSP